jgi:hypothetical protein
MGRDSRTSGDRSVSIGGNAKGNVIQTGDANVATISHQQVTLPPPESVDIQSELAAIRELLAGINQTESRKIGNAISDAEDEATREAPNRDEVGQALERALDYAQKTSEFASVVETLAPHVINACGWLGKNWYRLLGVVGLAL